MMRISDRKISEHRRIRKENQPKSHPCLRIAAITIAGMYLMSPTAAFTSSSGDRLSSNKITGQNSSSGTSCSSPISRLPYFGISTRPLSIISKTRLMSSNDQDSDKEEWRALLAAFTMYKAAYGDLKIPIRFVVPSLPPWPGK